LVLHSIAIESVKCAGRADYSQTPHVGAVTGPNGRPPIEYTLPSPHMAAADGTTRLDEAFAI